MDEITTLIVDDEPAIRDLARFIIETAEDGLCVVGEACDGQEAIDAVDRLHPQVVLLDVLMPRVGGLEAAARILQLIPEQRIILFSASMSESQRRDALAMGVRACLDKLKVAEMPELIREVAAAA